MLTRPGDWNQVLSTSFYRWTCGDKRLCRQRDTPDYQLKCQLVWCTVPLHWMCHYMCDTCVPRSISPGQKRRYRPQTVKIHDLQDYYDEMISVFKIIPLTKIQFCLNHCFSFFCCGPQTAALLLHVFVITITLHTLRLYFYGDTWTSSLRTMYVWTCLLPFCQPLILAISFKRKMRR